MKRINLLLFLIILVASFLRIWRLDSIPPSPDWDEVAYGYNAYSILNTGADEYGVKFPVILRSYDDYKPALYSYLSIPTVAVFGLNTFAVRLPDALFGVIGVLGTFFFVKKIFKRDDFALLSSFFMAVSPWQIQFSRFSHEAVVGVALNIFTVLFFIIGLKKPKYLFLSAFLWALSFYSYQSEKLFAPLLAILLSIIFFREILKLQKKYIAGGILIVFLVLLPMISYVVKDPNALSRAKGTIIFSYQTQILDKSAKQLILDKKNGNLLGLIIDNRRVVYAETFVKNYISHFNPNWLFLKGDLPRHHPPGMGVLYLWDLPFILLGIWFLFKTKLLDKRMKILIFGWFLLAPIPAALTFDVPHAARDLNVLPIFQIFTAVGVISFFAYLKKNVGRLLFKSSIIFVAILFLLNFTYYLNQYFVVLNQKYSSEWQYGYKEAISYIESVKGKYDNVLVSKVSPMDQSYMFFLFYLKYLPQKYQKEENNHSFDSFEFRKIDWEKDQNLRNTLIVGSPKDIPVNSTKIKTINFLDGSPAIIISQSDVK